MYQAPDFVKVDFKIDEAFATYNCLFISEGGKRWAFQGDDCHAIEVESGTDISGSVSDIAPYQCWLSPGK